jgi:hypothetical protein
MRRVSTVQIFSILAAGLAGISCIATSRAADDIPQNVLIQIQEKVRGVQKSLTMNDPWQVKLFNDEVVLNAQRFVRNYSSGSAGLSVDIDFEGIQKYLVFYAPKVLKRQNLSLVTTLRVDSECDKCKQAAEVIRGLMKSWAEHRGFNVKWVGPEDIGDLQLKDKPLQSRLADMAKMWDSAGVFGMELEQ